MTVNNSLRRSLWLWCDAKVDGEAV